MNSTSSKPTTPSLAVIGCGNMGEAILRGMLQFDSADRSVGRIIVVDRSDERRRDLHDRLGLDVEASALEAVRTADVVLLATKPQQLGEVFDELAGVCEGKLVVSIVAGVRSETIEAKLPGARVVRTMPNTPLLVGKGVVSLCRGATASTDDLEAARRLFTGAATFDLNEDQMDAATAVSGSGPAYFFAFVEALAAAGESVGLSADDARAMARETFIGAAALLDAGDDSPAELRRRVTSPGGTTAAALASFETSDLPAVVRNAVLAARDRGVELSRS